MIFNSYLVGDERAEAIAEARIDLVFAKADMMFEMVEMRLQQNLREAELKVFSEGGTYGDFQYLVEEAENEANEKKQGIIATLWNAIKSVLKKIGEKLASINVEPGDENTEVDVDEEDIKTNNAILDAVDKKLPGVEEAVKKRDLSGALKLAGEIAVAGAAVAAGAAVVTKKVTKGNLIKMKTTLTHAKEKVESFFGRIFGSNDNGDESILKQIGTTIKNKIIDPITKLIKKLGDYIKSGVTKAQNAIAGEWKEVEPKTKGAIECITNDKNPETNLDHVQMQQQDLEKKGCKDAEPGKWYIKETEKNGNRRQYVKCQKGDPGALEVVEDNKDPFDAKSMIKESDIKGVATKGEFVKPNDDNNDANKDSGKPKYVKCNSGDEGAKQVVADNTDPFDASKMVKASDVNGIASVNDFVKEDNTNADNNNNNSSPSGYGYSDVNELTKGVKGAGKNMKTAFIKISNGDFAGGIHIKDDNDNDAKKKGNLSLSKAKGCVYPSDLAAGDTVIKVSLKYDKPAKLYKLNNDPNTATKATPVPDGTPLSVKVVDNDNPAAGEVSRSKFSIAQGVNSVILESTDVEDIVGNSFMEATNEAYDNEIKEIATLFACL